MTPKTARRTRRLWLPGLLGSLSLTWLFYKVRNTRILRRPMLADYDWQTDPNAVADMSQLTPGAAPIRCQPWDIGTGVTGYVWHAPDPRAVLLLQHGLGEYAQRYVTRYDRLIPHFLNARISVYAFDLWGHGRSQGGAR
jgi:hypothetical protein